jgi:hypothetical protein
MQKIIGALAIAAALIAFASPASAADRRPCVAKLMAENGISPVEALHIPPARALRYDGQNVGTLAPGSSLWNMCAYAPALAESRAAQMASFNEAVTAQGRAYGAHLQTRVLQAEASERDARSSNAFSFEKSHALAVSGILIVLAGALGYLLALRSRPRLTARQRRFLAIADRVGECEEPMERLVQQIVALEDRLSAGHDSGADSLEALVGRLQEDVEFHERGARKNYERRAKALERLRKAQSALRRSLEREKALRDRVNELESVAHGAIWPAIGDAYVLTINGKDVRFPVIGHVPQRTKDGLLLMVKVSTPWDPEVGLNDAPQMAVANLSTDAILRVNKESVLRKLHALEKAHRWASEHGIEWRGSDGIKARDFLRGDGVPVRLERRPARDAVKANKAA